MIDTVEITKQHPNLFVWSFAEFNINIKLFKKAYTIIVYLTRDEFNKCPIELYDKYGKAISQN